MGGEGGREVGDDAMPLFLWHWNDGSSGYTAPQSLIVELEQKESSYLRGPYCPPGATGGFSPPPSLRKIKLEVMCQ